MPSGPLRQESACRFSLFLQNEAHHRAAIERAGHRFTNAGIFSGRAPGNEDECDEFVGLRYAGADSGVGGSPRLIRRNFSEVHFADFEIEQTVAHISAHLNVYGVHERPAASIVLVRGEREVLPWIPFRDSKRSGAGEGSI